MGAREYPSTACCLPRRSIRGFACFGSFRSGTCACDAPFAGARCEDDTSDVPMPMWEVLTIIIVPLALIVAIAFAMHYSGRRAAVRLSQWHFGRLRVPPSTPPQPVVPMDGAVGVSRIRRSDEGMAANMQHARQVLAMRHSPPPAAMQPPSASPQRTALRGRPSVCPCVQSPTGSAHTRTALRTSVLVLVRVRTRRATPWVRCGAAEDVRRGAVPAAGRRQAGLVRCARHAQWQRSACRCTNQTCPRAPFSGIANVHWLGR